MRIAICDDEKIFLSKLIEQVKKWADERGIVIDIHAFSNGDDLLRAHDYESMDLIILDIIMPLLNGIDAARELRLTDKDIPVIFLTSSRDFAVESYEVDAFYYLVKPVDEEKLFRVLDRFMETVDSNSETFTARTMDGFCKISLSDILYMEAQNKLVEVILRNGRKIEIHELFSRCEELFTIDKGFFKCHRSYIVNMAYVNQFTKTDIIMGIHTVPISRNRYSEFKEAYFEHMFHE